MSLSYLEKYAVLGQLSKAVKMAPKFSTRELERMAGPLKLKPKSPKSTISLPPAKTKTIDDVLEPQSYKNLTQGTPDLASQLAAIQRFLKG